MKIRNFFKCSRIIRSIKFCQESHLTYSLIREKNFDVRKKAHPLLYALKDNSPCHSCFIININQQFWLAADGEPDRFVGALQIFGTFWLTVWHRRANYEILYSLSRSENFLTISFLTSKFYFKELRNSPRSWQWKMAKFRIISPRLKRDWPLLVSKNS